MEKSEIYKQMLSEVDMIIWLHLTFPVRTATAESYFDLPTD